MIGHMVCASNGQLWVTDFGGGGGGDIHRYSGGLSGSWFDFSGQGGGWWGIAVHPTLPDNVVALKQLPANVNATQNGTAAGGSVSWTGSCGWSISAGAGAPAWLAAIVLNNINPTCGDIQFDPTGTKLLVPGIGEMLGTATMPTINTTVNWSVISQGIENQVATYGICSTGGVLCAAFLDNGLITVTPGTQPANTNNPIMQDLPGAFFLDWSPDHPEKHVHIQAGDNGFGFTASGYSLDNGATTLMFNDWFAKFSSSALTNDGTGQVQVNLNG